MSLTSLFCVGYHNIGIAMATPYGLVVPNIKKVQSLTILEVCEFLRYLGLYVFIHRN